MEYPSEYKKDMMEQLSKTELLHALNSMFDVWPFSALLVNQRKILLTANQEAEMEVLSLIGHKIKVGDNISDLIPEKYKRIFEQNFDSAIHGEKIKSIISFPLLNEKKWFDLFYLPVVHNEEIIGICIIFWQITNLIKTQEELLHHLDYMNIISNISSRFLYLKDMDQAINQSLKDIGEFSGASRAYIFMYSNDRQLMSNSHEWCAENVMSYIDELQNIPIEIFPWWNQTLQEKRLIKIENVAELDNIAAKTEKDYLEQQDIKSLIVLPIYSNNEMAGFIGFDNVINTGDWKENDIELLRVSSEIISSAVERKTYENTITENEYKYRWLFNNTSDFIFVNHIGETDLPEGFIEVNNPACERLDYTKSELNQKMLPDILDKEKFLSVWEREYKNNKKSKFSFQQDLLTKDKTGIPCEIQMGIFELFGRKVLLTTARDISERIVHEKNMNEQNAELLIILQKLKQAQSILVQQEKLAAIGQLSAGIAHEINNPLAFIISNFGTLRKYTTDMKNLIQSYQAFKNQVGTLFPEDKQVQSYIEDINRQEEGRNLDFVFSDLKSLFEDTADGMERVSNIVKSLKLFAHRDNITDFEYYDLVKGLESTLLITRNELKYYVQVEEDYEELPMIEANGQQINQIFLNIVLNAAYAIKSMNRNEKGHIKIHVWTEEPYVYCQITDDGPGIPENILPKIFEPFVTSKPIGEGTGLGLSMAKDTILRHNGEITAENIEGSGAMFTIKLPMKQS